MGNNCSREITDVEVMGKATSMAMVPAMAKVTCTATVAMTGNGKGESQRDSVSKSDGGSNG